VGGGFVVDGAKCKTSKSKHHWVHIGDFGLTFFGSVSYSFVIFVYSYFPLFIIFFFKKRRKEEQKRIREKQ
jgi:hypothetical protein